MTITTKLLLLIASISALSLVPTESIAPRQMERLGRGVVAVNQGDGKVFVSWRMLGDDPEATAFNLYRATTGAKAVKLNAKPIVDVTFFVDEKADLTKAVSYFVRAVINGREREASRSFTLPANAPVRQYLSISLQTPPGYAPNDASVGDLDGDGEYEIVLHQAGRGRDNSQAGMTDPPILEAYKLDGTLLWRINLGKNIREGAHYTQFIVYDLDGDGRAEVAMKTADGSMDAKGNVIGDSTKDWRNDKGYILAGPEFLTIFDGLTGVALATVDYIPPRYPTTLTPTTEQLKDMWGDGYGNRM